MLVPFDRDIWTVEGPPIVAMAGFRYPTRMVVIRLQDGALVLCSPVRLTDDLRRAVEALGPVRHLLAPNALHHVFLAEWALAFPAARLHAAPGLRAKRPDLTFHADLGARPDPCWAGQLDQVVIAGNRIVNEVVFFHRASRTALFTDLLQQMPPGWYRGWRSVVARLDLMTGAEPHVPRKFRVATKDRRAARVGIAQVLEWPVDHVLMAHGVPVRSDGAAFLRRAFRWLMD